MAKRKYNILLGVTGGIAAYKIPLLVRLLVQEGYEVKIILTESAENFVTQETLSVLSKNPVYTSFFNEKREWNNHVHLADWADIMVIAPATANTIAKMANGYCDNLLMATYLSFTKKVIVAPAMDAEMWEHETVRINLEQLKSRKNHLVLPVEYGALASGITGWGRMLEPQEIFYHVQKVLTKSEELVNKKVLVTAGATYEPIDPVRFIGNRSSGKTGIAISEELALRGAEVYLVHGNVTTSLPKHPDIKCIKASTAQEMYDACVEIFPNMNAAILAAAVADYTPVSMADEKIKKTDDIFQITLKKTKDILKTLGELKRKEQLLVGFALETNNVIQNAQKKLVNKNADMIFANQCTEENPAFNVEENELILLKKNNEIKNLGKHKKFKLAEKIVDEIVIALNTKNTS
ncbi:MAG: phosphopantothenoylcysteine decarboxylase [Bacteroidia bacterium]|nr:MAG: phosphopantothenoylcysteine decarboxylase [Bacteroidia bacterium]